MAWNVEYTDEFESWWVGLDEDEQIDIAAVVGLLEEKGPHLPYPYSSDVKGTKFGAIRELRIQHKGKPYRILYAFDPRRAAILLIGGKKTGGTSWYEQYVPLAERIYKEHLTSLKDDQGGCFMSKPYSILRGEMRPAARKKAVEKTKMLLNAMPLQELRHARHLSQEQLAQTLSVKQAAVSKLEKRTDMYISTLRNFIKAMGGDLEIIATFPDGSVQISQFENISEKTERGNLQSLG